MPYISFAHPTFEKVARVMTFNEFQNAGEFLGDDDDAVWEAAP